MFSSDFFARHGRTPLLALALAVALAGCESKQDKAIDQAKKQAVATGQPQQVVSVDKTGTTTTTVVQPPAKGQTTEAMTTTTTPPTPGAPVPPPQDPKVYPVGGDPNQGQDQAGSSCRAGWQARLRQPDRRPRACDDPGGNQPGDPRRPAHQREDQPPRRHLYGRSGGTGG